MAKRRPRKPPKTTRRTPSYPSGVRSEIDIERALAAELGLISPPRSSPDLLQSGRSNIAVPRTGDAFELGTPPDTADVFERAMGRRPTVRGEAEFEREIAASRGLIPVSPGDTFAEAEHGIPFGADQSFLDEVTAALAPPAEAAAGTVAKRASPFAAVAGELGSGALKWGPYAIAAAIAGSGYLKSKEREKARQKATMSIVQRRASDAVALQRSRELERLTEENRMRLMMQQPELFRTLQGHRSTIPGEYTVGAPQGPDILDATIQRTMMMQSQ